MAAAVQHATLGSVAVVNQAVKELTSGIVHPTPEKGEHTDEVLREYGFDDKAITGFRARSIV